MNTTDKRAALDRIVAAAKAEVDAGNCNYTEAMRWIQYAMIGEQGHRFAKEEAEKPARKQSKKFPVAAMPKFTKAELKILRELIDAGIAEFEDDDIDEEEPNAPEYQRLLTARAIRKQLFPDAR